MERRIWTIPNVISVVRLACVPWFLWLIWVADEISTAAVLLAVLGATDWVDGWIARRFDQGSELGKVLDPVADRALLIAAAVGILTIDMPGAVKILVLVVGLREVLVAAATVVIAAAGARRIDVLWVGKAGTFAVMVAFPLLLLASDIEGDAAVLVGIAGWICGIVGAALSWYAAIRYLPAAQRALREGRAARAAGAAS